LRCSALVFRGDTVLLCRRSDDEVTWVLPGGTPRPGEGTAATAEREFLEETGISIDADQVAFVFETTSRDVRQHLIEIVFLGTEQHPNSEPRQSESGLVPAFVPLEELRDLGLRPPIGGYIRRFALYQKPTSVVRGSHTAAYLGNLWRATDVDDLPTPAQTQPS
jgi:ADP-ribose pyrophosphatase YjhB (NUDIX family)